MYNLKKGCKHKIIELDLERMEKHTYVLDNNGEWKDTVKTVSVPHMKILYTLSANRMTRRLVYGRES